jgi:Ca2+-binding EF-hand superfamily protein
MVSSISISSLWATQVANANSAAQRHKDIFQKLDTNRDGKIDESELKTAVTAAGITNDIKSFLKEVDTNGDGTIEEKENDAFLIKMEGRKNAGGPPPGSPPHGGGVGMKSGSASESADKVYDVLDTNKDGKVSLQELMAAMGADETETDASNLLKQVDSDSDGSISKAEFSNYLTKLEKQLDSILKIVQSYDKQGGTQNDSSVGTTVNTLV